MAETLILHLELLDFWHCGQAGGDGLSAPMERDSAGLPFVSGRRLKGLLRAAVECCEGYGRVPVGCAARLFGSPEGRPATVRVNDARLPVALRAWLAAPENELCRRALFREVYFSDERAVRGLPLRGLEVAVPMQLEAELAALREPPPAAEWADLIAAALPLVSALGSHRSRGLGRCVLRVVGCR